MRATIWGCRGSLATPGNRTIRYGGNTCSVEVRTAGGRLVVLDAGTGIRELGLTLAESPAHVDLLLTHLHLDHIEGLGFFAPLFATESEITIWGPHQAGSSLEERVRGYLSPPFFPVPFERFPSRIQFHELGEETWSIDGLKVTAAAASHPGDTLAYRLEEDGRSLAYIPDNELGLHPEAGATLADGADLLFHDAQYTADEYAARHGWGHASLPDLAGFLERVQPQRTVMFHHDPSHSDDMLEAMHATAQELAGRELALAAEGAVYEL
ncbi:MAG TPA: MBL fold metallo-hydrolase [Gaiellaceae bacterium]|nr:MBL fold metallo-hydrolase [Gaiellaceae bacterium]